jgi:hypothetical protein
MDTISIDFRKSAKIGLPWGEGRRFFALFAKSIHRREEGQAVIEYILMAFVALSFILAINTIFRRTTNRLWVFYIRQVTAACPGCPPDPTYQYR